MPTEATIHWLEQPSSIAELTTAALESVGDEFDKYMVFPSREARDAVVLWTLHTHVFDAFDSTPRLSVRSKEPGSGKSRVLEIVDQLAPNTLNAVYLTPAVMWRAIEHGTPTMILDECDTVFGINGSSSRQEHLRAIINAGHRKGATVPRPVGQSDVKEFHVFAPVAMAGIGRLPETIATRSVEVVMRKRREGDPEVKPFRMRFAADDLDLARKACEKWAHRAIKRLARELPDMPVADRKADVWEPLIAIADMADGDWPARARKACIALTAEADEKEDSIGVRLLGSFRDVFGDETVLTVHEASASLDTMPEWEDYSTKAMTKLLAEYGIKATTVRIDGVPTRAYKRKHFEPAWERYCSPVNNDADEEEDGE